MSSVPGSFAGLGFFSLFLNQMLNISRRYGNDVIKLVLIVLPLFVAVAISITRVNDYMHHWQDVSVGGIIGKISIAFLHSQSWDQLFILLSVFVFPLFGCFLQA
jgi:membrane-associated phospholipid phosphatase